MKNNSFLLKNKLGIGEKFPVRVNLNFGINSKKHFDEERKKLDLIFNNSKVCPDLGMDLSTIKLDYPLYKYIIDTYDIPIGLVPAYTSYNKDIGIDINVFLKNLEVFAKNGISFFTLHLNANIKTLEYAKKFRKIPVTSRGGALLLKDQILNNRENILLKYIDEIIDICKMYDVAISLGTTFRPASTLEACDLAHITETNEQLELCNFLKSKNINVILENIGHISLDKISEHIKILKNFECPIMPLGPLPTDTALENDHIASAIGSSFLGFNNCTHIINSITPAEHTRSNVTFDDMIAGLSAARISAKIINLSKKEKNSILEEELIYEKRYLQNNCLDLEDNCFRCAKQCPLRLI